MTIWEHPNGADYLDATWLVTTYGGPKEPPEMKSKLMVYDADALAFKKGDPDYDERLRAWAIATTESERKHWDALCEVLYAAHYKMMETAGGYAVDHEAVDRLDAAIDTILEAMPERAKARFDELMQRPCAS